MPTKNHLSYQVVVGSEPNTVVEATLGYDGHELFHTCYISQRLPAMGEGGRDIPKPNSLERR